MSWMLQEDSSSSAIRRIGDARCQLVLARRWPVAGVPRGLRASVGRIEDSGRIVEFEALRGGWASPREKRLAIPEWMLGNRSVWTGVPLLHQQRLVGLVILAAPEYRRALDWEDFDLLRTAGNQAASSLAEAMGQEALANAQRFEEFNRRFAFILHDIKNLVSQLSLLARNAERHADNPEFRADMLATLQSSVGKMNELLARLAPRSACAGAADRASVATADPGGDNRRDAAGPGYRAVGRRRYLRAGRFELRSSRRSAISFRMRSMPAAERRSRVNVAADSASVSVSIADKGVGMDGDFIRNRLVPAVRLDEARRLRHRRVRSPSADHGHGRTSRRRQPAREGSHLYHHIARRRAGTRTRKEDCMSESIESPPRRRGR